MLIALPDGQLVDTNTIVSSTFVIEKDSINVVISVRHTQTLASLIVDCESLQAAKELNASILEMHYGKGN